MIDIFVLPKLFLLFLFLECGGDLVNPTGVIMSPNYPGLYPHTRTCAWKIKVQDGRRVTLTFEDFKLEEGASCFFDHVAVSMLTSLGHLAPVLLPTLDNPKPHSTQKNVSKSLDGNVLMPFLTIRKPGCERFLSRNTNQRN